MEPRKPVIVVVVVYLSEKIQIKVSKGKRYLGQNPGETMSGSYCPPISGIIFFVVQLLSSVRLYVTPWTAACGAPLLFTISRSLLKLMSIGSVMPSNHLILCPLFSSCLQSFPVSGSFPKSQLLTFSNSPSCEYSGLISFRIDWLVWSPCSPRDSQESSPEQLKSISLQHLAFFMVQLSHPYLATNSIKKVEAVRSCKQHLTIPAMICNSRDKLLPTREIHLSLGVQAFYWRSIT